METLDTKNKPADQASNNLVGSEEVFKITKCLLQDRNSLKFMLRIFMKYQREFVNHPSDIQRISAAQEAYVRICEGRQ